MGKKFMLFQIFAQRLNPEPIKQMQMKSQTEHSKTTVTLKDIKTKSKDRKKM